jgi:Phosphatidylinositol-4-phosphate 5-Kinase
MENLFFEYPPTRVFDIKGSNRARYVADDDSCTFEEALLRRRRKRKSEKGIASSAEFIELDCETPQKSSAKVLLDDNFVRLSGGRPFPLKKRAKEYLEKAVMNDSTFLSVINVVDYSILVGVDEASYSIKVGIIDFKRQYDFLKKMEHMSKSVGMLTGQAEPTIIEPQHYKRRFQAAIEKYFLEVPDVWSEL